MKIQGVVSAMGAATMFLLSLTADAQSGRTASTPQSGGAQVARSSPKEMITQASQKLAALHSAIQECDDTLKKARAKADVQAMSCINDALIAIKGFERLALQNNASMQEAAKIGDAVATEHEFVKITIAYEKAMELVARVHGCSGPDMTGEFDGKPKVEVTIDSDIAAEGPADWLRNMEILLVVPNTTSPYF